MRDTATSLPSGYEPPQVFNQSLQSTNPKLSWDADDNSRKRVLQKRCAVGVEVWRCGDRGTPMGRDE